ncbi:MAG: hypothetical protein MUF18_12720 [Fimbriiglobus sp.]|nr:hypothetical protein [Fimbriiglobus sp.]
MGSSATRTEHLLAALVLSVCDARARVPGATVGTIDVTRAFIRRVEEKK